MARAIATMEAVERAADEIVATGAAPTVELVRERVGGGSYSTISKLLKQYMEARQEADAKASELPEVAARVIRDAIARVAHALDTESSHRVESVARAYSEKHQQIQSELEAADKEIARLEQDLAACEKAKLAEIEARSAAEKRSAELTGRLKAKEEQLESLSSRLDTDRREHRLELAEERERTREAEGRARAAEEIAAQLRGQLRHQRDSSISE